MCHIGILAIAKDISMSHKLLVEKLAKEPMNGTKLVQWYNKYVIIINFKSW